MGNDLKTEIHMQNVYFYENLSLATYFIFFLRKKPLYFKSQTLLLRLFLQIFNIDTGEQLKRITEGSLNHATDIRKTAYEAAIIKIKEINPIKWGLKLDQLLHIDQSLIIEKFLMEFLFTKYEYYGFVRQFSNEHPNTDIKLVVDPLFFDGLEISSPNLIVSNASSYPKFKLFIDMAAIFFYTFFFYRKNRVDDKVNFQNAVICEVDCKKIADMFVDLFGKYQEIYFVIQKVYLRNFKKEEVIEYGLITHGLSLVDYQNLKTTAIHFFRSAIKNSNKNPEYGAIMFQLYYKVANGMLLTPYARNCTYLTFEHLNVSKAVRNELLRVGNNKSIFMPYNVYSSSPFYAPEYRYNYDVLCSPGKICEMAYIKQLAKTKLFLPTGSYHTNKKFPSNDEAYKIRQQQLLDFKGDSTAITILSNGVEDITFSGEVKMMALARRLSREPNVKLFIRQKPTEAPEIYKNFFIDEAQNINSIMLTHSEYELFDFAAVTDLFITSSSSSVLDFCAAGADFFSVNCWNRKDLFLWQTAVDGVYLEEDEAFNAIMAWVNNAPPDQRELHSKRMMRLRELTRYKFDDFESYKSNLLSLLNPYLPNILSQ